MLAEYLSACSKKRATPSLSYQNFDQLLLFAKTIKKYKWQTSRLSMMFHRCWTRVNLGFFIFLFCSKLINLAGFPATSVLYSESLQFSRCSWTRACVISTCGHDANTTSWVYSNVVCRLPAKLASSKEAVAAPSARDQEQLGLVVVTQLQRVWSSKHEEGETRSNTKYLRNRTGQFIEPPFEMK